MVIIRMNHHHHYCRRHNNGLYDNHDRDHTHDSDDHH